MTDDPTPPAPQEAQPPPVFYRIWCLSCPFTKTGFPVMGTFGKTERTVVILSLETWKRLCADVPQLQITQFEVGQYD